MFEPAALKFLKDSRKAKEPAWFEKRRDLYHDLLKNPFTEILELMEKRFQKELPHFRFSPRSISRPMRTPDRAIDKGLMKDYIACAMGPRKTSRFEMPPCFYLSIGVDHTYFGAGLYMPSGPQLRHIRLAIEKDPHSLDRLLKTKKFKSAFDGLNPERMKRLPRGFSVEPKFEYLLRTKSFSVHRDFTARELTRKTFATTLVQTAEASLPLIQWLDSALAAHTSWSSR